MGKFALFHENGRKCVEKVHFLDPFLDEFLADYAHDLVTVLAPMENHGFS